jgi:hypothetical protein
MGRLYGSPWAAWRNFVSKVKVAKLGRTWSAAGRLSARPKLLSYATP